MERAADAFEDIASDESDRQRDQYERALDLLDDQAAYLIEAGNDTTSDEPRHTPYRPHWRGLSSAARRLVRAHEQVERSRD
jgi:hypothetical protein